MVEAGHKKLLDIIDFIRYNTFTDSVKAVNVMKQHYTEQQYEQLAKEQICSLAKEIPFVSDVEIYSVKPNGAGDFTAVVHFEDGRSSVELSIDVKARGERRFVEQFIQFAERHGKSGRAVLAAPYITEKSANLLKENGCSYMDLSGNCRISVPPLFILMEGRPNRFTKYEYDRNYFGRKSSAASALLRTLLQDHKRIWKVQELAERSGKSLGAAANVKSFLVDHGWAEDSKQGFRLCQIEELLRAWAKEYHRRENRIIRCYSLDAPVEIERAVSNWNEQHGGSAVLGGFGAAARYVPRVRYNKVSIYVEPQDVDEFMEALELETVTSGDNVTIIIPHDETPCLFTNEIGGCAVTSPVQTVLDLLSGVGRGEEAAAAIIEKEYSDDDRR